MRAHFARSLRLRFPRTATSESTGSGSASRSASVEPPVGAGLSRRRLAAWSVSSDRLAWLVATSYSFFSRALSSSGVFSVESALMYASLALSAASRSLAYSLSRPAWSCSRRSALAMLSCRLGVAYGGGERV